MSWKNEVNEIAHRRELRKQMGGPEGIERQRRRGKLTVRERIDALVDSGGFEEFYSLAGAARYGKDNELTSFMPRGVVEGMGQDRWTKGGSYRGGLYCARRIRRRLWWNGGRTSFQ